MSAVIRVRNLTARCTETVEDFTSWWESDTENLKIGRTFIEAEPEVLLSIVDQLRTDETYVDHNSDNVALQEQSIKNAEDARQRWANKIERHARRALESAAFDTFAEAS
jgi:hypothetical protein